jgi:hypothetical protein
MYIVVVSSFTDFRCDAIKLLSWVVVDCCCCGVRLRWSAIQRSRNPGDFSSFNTQSGLYVNDDVFTNLISPPQISPALLAPPGPYVANKNLT